MKVLLINGSPHKEGNTHRALSEIATTLAECGIEAEIFWIGNKAAQGCIACNKCVELGHCIFRDEVTVALEKKFDECDALIVGSPVYFAGPTGALCALLDRMFRSYSRAVEYKPAASVAVARRAGATVTVDRLNKYFMISSIPVVTSQYWNLAFGGAAGEVADDGEGMQTMRTLARNMAWMLKSLSTTGHPSPEPRIRTNFIR